MSSRVPPQSFRVLHCLRAPVGGLFRHVCDLAAAQSEAGHSVGVLCADKPNDPQTLDRLSALERHCNLGVTRIGLGRMPGVSDLRAVLATSRKIREIKPDVLHGHGAKGGLLARCTPASKPHPVRVYTPHGGSIHYAPNSVSGVLFGAAEKVMLARTDGLIFESEFARSVFSKRFGELPINTQIVHNGLALEEFDPIPLIEDPADFLFLGEIRELKGIFTLLDAISKIASHRAIRVDVAGDGPDMAAFRAAIETRSLTGSVNVLGQVPAREALARARAVVLPSHQDSFPYVALEAAAAGRPLIATSTGGVPEIFGPFVRSLIDPANVQELHNAMEHFLDHEADHMRLAQKLRDHVRHQFSLSGMAAGVASAYANALAGSVRKHDAVADSSPNPKLDAAE